NLMPGPALETAPTLFVKGAVLIDHPAVKPDLGDDVDTVDVKHRRLPFIIRQCHPEPDVAASGPIRRIGRKADGLPLLRLISQGPERHGLIVERRVAPAVLPALMNGLHYRNGGTGNNKQEQDPDKKQ